jgi:hypothetical protein
MKPHVTEEGKTAQDNFTNAMKTLFRAPKHTTEAKPKPKTKRPIKPTS